MGIFGTIGSVGGAALGTAIGGPIGGVLGGMAGGALGSMLEPSEVAGMSDAEKAQLAQTRAQQAALADQLRLQAAGQGPNPAALQANRALNTSVRQNQGFIASQKGMNPALAQRLAAQNQALAGTEVAGRSSELAAQQQLASQGQLAALLSGQAQQGLQAQQLQNQMQMAQDQRNSQMFGGLLNAGGALGSAYMMQNKGGSTSGGSTPSAGIDASSSGNISAGGGGYSLGGGGITVQGYSSGGKVAGKAKDVGNNPQNDTVPAMLSPGEIVVPRSASKNPSMAKEFIDHIMKQKGSEGSNKDIGYEDIMSKQLELQKKVAALEKKLKGK